MWYATLVPGLAAALAMAAMCVMRSRLGGAVEARAANVNSIAHSTLKQQSAATKDQAPTPAGKRPRLPFLALAILLAALVSGVSALLLPASNPASQEPALAAAVPVKVARVTQAEWSSVVSIPGTVSAVDTANLASRTGGWVTKVTADAGAQVEKGDLLAEVGTVDLHAQLAQAEARLATAKASFDQTSAQESRYRTLQRDRYASTAQYQGVHRDFLAAGAELDAATLALKAAKSNIDYAEIRAPFAGIVAQKNIWPGDYAAPGATLFVIASGTPEIRARAGAATFGSLKAGDKAVVAVDGKPLPAVVTRLVGAADPQTRTHLVKLRLEGGATAPFGAYAEVRLNLGRFQALAVPEAALTKRAGLVSVFALGKDNRAHLRLVRTGEREDGRVAIMAGLKEGQSVILNPSANLENGSLALPSSQARKTGITNG